MLPEDYQRLKEDLLFNGYDPKNPIYIYQDDILDGWNRYVACKEIGGITPTYKEFVGSDSEAIAYVMRTNKRRNLTSSQWAAIAVEAEELIAVIRAEVEKERRTKQAETRKAIEYERDPDGRFAPKDNNESDITQLIVEQVKPRIETSAKLAGTFSTNRTYINEAAKIKKEQPEMFVQIKSGEKTITEIKRDIKKKEVIANLTSIESQNTKKILGIYDVIIIDPPWPMEKIERDVSPNQVGFDYPTMPIEEIKQIKLPVDDNCHVFMWTTQKFLSIAFEVLKSWDVKYIFTMVWHKPGGFQPFNLPQYNCEFILYARRGSPQFIDTKSFNTCFTAARGKHSEKPDVFYDIIRRVTVGRRLDMFNRREIPGFDGWGNESISDE